MKLLLSHLTEFQCKVCLHMYNSIFTQIGLANLAKCYEFSLANSENEPVATWLTK